MKEITYISQSVINKIEKSSLIPHTLPLTCLILSCLIMMSCGRSGGSTNNTIIDTQSPSMPTVLTLTVVSDGQIELSWIASSDNTGVSGYRIYKDDVEVGTTSSTAYSDSVLLPSTTYCYEISAYDASSNESPRSTLSCATTDSSPSSWNVFTLDSTGDVGLSTSISTGSIHISYYDSTNDQLKYIKYSSGSWSTPISVISVGSISLATTFSALVLDSHSNIFLTYYDATAVLNGDLRLITCPVPNDCSDSANWNNVLIDSTGDVGSDTAIHIDLRDNIHISYYDSDNGYLKYAYCQAGSNCNLNSNWSSSIIDNSGDVGQYSSIASDSSNNIHISYYDSAGLFTGNLKYASCMSTNDCTDPSNWNTVPIDSTEDAGQYSSITCDSGDNIHISYYDVDNGNLKYAFCLSSSDCTQTSNWNTVTIDSAVDVGDYSSIAADSQNDLHISYHDFNNDNLKYASCNSTADCTLSSSWEIIIVDATTGVGEFSSVAADENDNIHISYYDSYNEDLKYAVKQ